MSVVMVRQVTGAPERECDLQEPETHQIGAERDAKVDEPTRNFEIRGDLIGIHQPDHEFRAHCSDHRGEESPAKQSEQHDYLSPRRPELIDENIDPDVNSG